MIEHWYAALREEIGVVVEVTGDREAARQKLYAARVDAMDPDLECLQILVSPVAANQLWIVRKEIPSAPSQAEGTAEGDAEPL